MAINQADAPQRRILQRRVTNNRDGLIPGRRETRTDALAVRADMRNGFMGDPEVDAVNRALGLVDRTAQSVAEWQNDAFLEREGERADQAVIDAASGAGPAEEHAGSIAYQEAFYNLRAEADYNAWAADVERQVREAVEADAGPDEVRILMEGQVMAFRDQLLERVPVESARAASAERIMGFANRLDAAVNERMAERQNAELVASTASLGVASIFEAFPQPEPLPGLRVDVPLPSAPDAPDVPLVSSPDAPVPGRAVIEYTPRDLDALTRMIYGEAGGESEDGQVAAAWVAINRTQRDGYGGRNLHSVVYARHQFEAMGRRDVRDLSTDSAAYRRAQTLARRILSGEIADPTGGAVNFINPEMQVGLNRDIPSWARGGGQRIGRHVFFGGTGRPAQPSVREVTSRPQETSFEPLAEGEAPAAPGETLVVPMTERVAGMLEMRIAQGRAAGLPVDALREGLVAELLVTGNDPRNPRPDVLYAAAAARRPDGQPVFSPAQRQQLMGAAAGAENRAEQNRERGNRERLTEASRGWYERASIGDTDGITDEIDRGVEEGWIEPQQGIGLRHAYENLGNEVEEGQLDETEFNRYQFALTNPNANHGQLLRDLDAAYTRGQLGYGRSAARAYIQLRGTITGRQEAAGDRARVERHQAASGARDYLTNQLRPQASSGGRMDAAAAQRWVQIEAEFTRRVESGEDGMTVALDLQRRYPAASATGGSFPGSTGVRGAAPPTLSSQSLIYDPATDGLSPQ